MRVTDKMGYTQVTTNIQKNRSEMADLQNQASTQKRINKPSDDPTASARVLTSRTEERGGLQFLKNINIARSFLEYTDQSLSELAESLMRAKELAIQQASDAGSSADTRKVVASEVEQIHHQAVQIGNRKLAERYIFGGYKTNAAPFDTTGEYAGDNGSMKVQINKDAFVEMNISGDKVFLGQGLGDDGLVKNQAKVPKDRAELVEQKNEEIRYRQELEEKREGPLPLRGPATESRPDKTFTSVDGPDARGTNILKVLKDFEIALKVNDKDELQAAIDNLDLAIGQVVSTRSQVGSRISALNSGQDSLQKANLDNKATASQLEDADIYQVVSDMNKTDSTLRASLETASKVSNMSLLDFLK